MLEFAKRFFSKALPANAAADGRQSEHDVRVAACALFLEMGRIDGTFSPAEQEMVLSILEEKYGLSPQNAAVLVEEAGAQREESVDLWQFARLINENYSVAEKLEIIELLWRIVYVDGHMDKFERYLMHKLSNLLRLSHRQLIDAKLKVLHPD